MLICQIWFIIQSKISLRIPVVPANDHFFFLNERIYYFLIKDQWIDETVIAEKNIISYNSSLTLYWEQNKHQFIRNVQDPIDTTRQFNYRSICVKAPNTGSNPKLNNHNIFIYTTIYKLKTSSQPQRTASDCALIYIFFIFFNLACTVCHSGNDCIGQVQTMLGCLLSAKLREVGPTRGPPSVHLEVEPSTQPSNMRLLEESE